MRTFILITVLLLMIATACRKDAPSIIYAPSFSSGAGEFVPKTNDAQFSVLAATNWTTERQMFIGSKAKSFYMADFSKIKIELSNITKTNTPMSERFGCDFSDLTNVEAKFYQEPVIVGKTNGYWVVHFKD